MQLLPPTKEVCEGYVFTRVCLSTGGSAGPHPGGRLRGLAGGSPGPQPGGRLRSLAGGSPGPHPGWEIEESGWRDPDPHLWGVPGPHQGVSRPRPGGRGCIPACTEADPPPQADGYCCGRECILVLNVFQTLFNLLLRCYVVMGVGLL